MMKIYQKLKKEFKLLAYGLILIPVNLVVLFLLIIYLQNAVINVNFKVNLWTLIKNNLSNWQTILLSLCGGVVIYFIYVYLICFYKKQHNAKIVNTTQTDYGSSQWLNSQQLDQKYPVFSFNKPNHNHGFVIASKQTYRDVLVNTRTNTHTLVTGGTGSGKTQGLVIPTIQTNASSLTKPCLVITDPKGELYNTQSLLLEQQGYQIKVLNLREPYNSNHWNPLQVIYDFWMQALALNFGKNNFAIIQQKILLQSKAHEEIRDLCKTLFPIKSKDPFWDLAASSLVKAIILGMLEDIEQIILNTSYKTWKEANKFLEENFPLKQFNLATVTKIATQKEAMKLWFHARDNNSPAKIAASIILNNSDVTLNSILASVSARLEIFGDLGIQNLISDNDFEFLAITTQPTAIFIIVPDERNERHFFASLFISQLYKALIDCANQLANNQLTRPIYFLCDEFGNLPAIDNMDAIITVSRSRQIYFMLIVQDLKQLESKYGHEVTNIIFANCSMHIYLQTLDLKTAKTYSEIIGNKTVLQVNTSKSNDKSNNKSEQLKAHPLISTDELINLPMNEAVVIFSKEHPARTKLLPWWKNKNYLIGKTKKLQKIVKLNNNLYYDICKSYYFKLSNNKQQTVQNHKDNFNEQHSLIERKQKLKQLQKQLKLLQSNKELTMIEKVVEKNLIDKMKFLSNKK